MNDDKDDKQKLYDLLYRFAGEAECGEACTDAQLYREDGEWKLFLCGFMEPWPLGKTVAEAEVKLREYARGGFGLDAPRPQPDA